MVTKSTNVDSQARQTSVSKRPSVNHGQAGNPEGSDSVF
jgi:hypothetical protein